MNGDRVFSFSPLALSVFHCLSNPKASSAPPFNGTLMRNCACMHVHKRKLGTRREVHRSFNIHIMIPRKSSMEGNLPKFLPHPKYSEPSPAHRLLNSCRHPPILLSFHRLSIGGANQISRGEEIREGLAASRRAFFSLSCSSFSRALPHTLVCTQPIAYTQSEIHTCRGQERELPWETEAWVKEGCWQ